MPEASEDATILIAISWQALERVRNKNKKTELCNCTISLVFAAFYIEANLNHIIEKMNKTKEMNNFFKNNKHPGLHYKLGWFYNRFVARPKAQNSDQLRNKYHIENKIKKSFPGFYKIYDFRNNISHGHIDHSLANKKKTEKLRERAKQIVDKLFDITKKSGYVIPRSTTYEIAIAAK